MGLAPNHVQRAFVFLRDNGILPNRPSTKWDVIDPKTGDRFPPKAVLRVAKELAGDNSSSGGGGWPTNDPLRELGFEIALKSGLEDLDEASDIAAIVRSDAGETAKLRLINARLGQGGFREQLLEIWGGKCAITGCEIAPVLRASHIKAWRDSTDLERLDPNNGILLAASLDALFDKNLITLTTTGSIQVSKLIARHALTKLGVQVGHRISLNSQAQVYLESHRAIFDRLSDGESFEFDD